MPEEPLSARAQLARLIAAFGEDGQLLVSHDVTARDALGPGVGYLVRREEDPPDVPGLPMPAERRD